jgi:hypothetical protein
MSILFDNNASATNSVQVEIVDTTVTLQTNEGQLFPNPTGADFFICTLEDTSGNVEIVRCTDNTADVLTVTRAQENTTAKLFPTGSKVEIRTTAGVFGEFLQKSGGTMSGELDMANNILRDPLITDGEARNMPIRGTDGGTANELVVPTAGGDPTIGGSTIVTVANADYVPTSRTLTGGDGIGPIGDLSANRTIDFLPSELSTRNIGNISQEIDSYVLDDNGTPVRMLFVDSGFQTANLSSSTVITTAHLNKYLRCSHATGMNITLNTTLGNVRGNWIVIEQEGVGRITINGTATVNSPNGLLTAEQYSTVVLIYVQETGTWTLSGDMAP